MPDSHRGARGGTREAREYIFFRMVCELEMEGTRGDGRGVRWIRVWRWTARKDKTFLYSLMSYVHACASARLQ